MPAAQTQGTENFGRVHMTSPGMVHTASPGIVHTATPAKVHAASPGMVHSPTPGTVHTALPGTVHTASPGTVHTTSPGMIHSAVPGMVQPQAAMYSKGPAAQVQEGPEYSAVAKRSDPAKPARSPTMSSQLEPTDTRKQIRRFVVYASTVGQVLRWKLFGLEFTLALSKEFTLYGILNPRKNSLSKHMRSNMILGG
jgi:hypothetical protein